MNPKGCMTNCIYTAKLIPKESNIYKKQYSGNHTTPKESHGDNMNIPCYKYAIPFGIGFAT